MTLPLAAILVLTFFGSLAQGALGVGIGIVATPLVAAIDPSFVPGPMLVPMLFAASWTAWRDRAAIAWMWTGAALGGRLPGTIVGAWVLALVPLIVYAWIFAGTVLLGVLLSLIAPKTPPKPGPLAIGGFFSGVMGTLTSIGSPPITLVLQHAAPARVRATLSAYFAVGSVMSLCSLAAFGQFGPEELFKGLSLLPPMSLGVWLSARLTLRVDRGLLRPAILVLAVLAAPLLVFRALMLG